MINGDAGCAPHQPVIFDTETTSLGLLPDRTDRHVHAVYDPAEDLPLSACGLRILPDIYLGGAVVLCGRCRAALRGPDKTELRPATNERRLARPTQTGPLTGFERWRLAHRHDRRIRRAVAKEWHRG